MNCTLSDIEIERRDRIAANLLRIQQFGLEEAFANFGQLNKKTKTKRKKKNATPQSPILRRQSSRIMDKTIGQGLKVT